MRPKVSAAARAGQGSRFGPGIADYMPGGMAAAGTLAQQNANGAAKSEPDF